MPATPSARIPKPIMFMWSLGGRFKAQFSIKSRTPESESSTPKESMAPSENSRKWVVIYLACYTPCPVASGGFVSIGDNRRRLSLVFRRR